MSASAPSATPAAKRPRRARTIITAPLPRDGRAHNDMANALILDAQLKRLIDRQRHAIARMTDKVQVVRRFRFDGLRMPSYHKPEHCWWFREDAASGAAAAPAMRQGSVLGRGPSTGTRRWCYLFESAPIAHMIKLDWREITTASLSDIFETWQNESALQQTAGLGECMRECAPRRKAVREELDPVLLHVWNLRQLIEDHMHRYCGEAADAWQLKYKECGLVDVPPLRIMPHDIFPLTEHEAQVLQRRPHFASLLHRVFTQQHGGAASEPEEKEPEPEPPVAGATVTAAAAAAASAPARYGQLGVVRSFRPDYSILSSVTPDYDSHREEEEEEEEEIETMDTSA